MCHQKDDALASDYAIHHSPPISPVIWCHDNVKTIHYNLHAIYCVWNGLRLTDQRHYILVVALAYQEGEQFIYTHKYTSYWMLCVWKKYSILDSYKTPYNSDVKVWSLPTAHGWIRHSCMTMPDTTTLNLGFKIKNTCILCQSIQLFVYQWWHEVLLTNNDMRLCLPMMTQGFAYQ